ncbi:MAG: NAD-dependent epimerase/dehydratase family protein [Gemmatimonadota bacterium]|nr:MAG: NAD-dependent epimerase/dehydratase family protein [Gemmatimonadota bacterium]
MHNVFVTGGTGLIGSHVVRLLVKAGHGVTAMVRDDAGAVLMQSWGAKAVRGAVEDRESWSAARNADAIVHSAALVSQRSAWETFQAVNVGGTENAARTAAQLGVRLVHISSVAVYGRRPQGVPNAVTEQAQWLPLRSTDYYARSKRAAEQVLRQVAAESELSWVALRPCVVYGERDRVFLPRIVGFLQRGIAPLVGRGGNTLTVVYAGNVAEAVFAALTVDDAAGPFNTTNDGAISQRDFFAAVGAAMGLRLRFIHLPRPVATSLAVGYHGMQRVLRPRSYPGFGIGAARFLAADNPFSSDRARTELHWRPSTPPAIAIERSTKWFTNHETE